MAKPGRKLTQPTCPTCGAYHGHQRQKFKPQTVSSKPENPPAQALLTEVRELKLLVKQTSSQAQVGVIKTHALLVEVQELRSELSRLSTLFAALVDDPESRAYAEAQLKKFIHERNQ